ncbi:DUF952 domain-containing protein [Kineosporia sp. NBRC 101731]|uniref:DUF952 domain-containing protein n=1 Tax=Kineosporia sp. NBRC 101731 TaxID=3032199 RepID=UPI0024A5059D|nr:DUF952 domain-containing protein [Kineosporia sp. NBRC 101731]GLY28040.1 hypothetical protein Kisp02_14050 [Kineosporia sp. NBRC 101731]
MTRVLHIALEPDWAQALTLGRYEKSSRDVTLAQEGFIHASTVSQATVVLSTFYGDLPPADLRLLVVDEEKCAEQGTPMRWDDVPGSDSPFPHFYGPIPVDAVVAVLEFTGPELPDVTPYDVAR